MTISPRRDLRELERVFHNNIPLRYAPKPPRELDSINGVLSWKAPQDERGVTHYNIYAESNSNLVRRVPAGQKQMQDNLAADRVWISSYNAYAHAESSKVFLDRTVAPPPAPAGDVVVGPGLVNGPDGITLATDVVEIRNGGFEFDLKDWFYDAGYTITSAAGTFHSGSKAATVSGVGKHLWQQFRVKPGDAWVLEPYCKAAPGTTGTVACIVRYFNAAGGHLLDVSASLDASAAADWKAMTTGAVAAPAGAALMQAIAFVTLSGSGAWYIDQVTLRKATDAREILTDTIASYLGMVSGVFGLKPEAITSDLIHDLAVTTQKIVDEAVGTNKIAPFATTAAKIANAVINNAHLDRASANKIAIVNADIVTLAAAKILAGTLAAGVIYAGTITVGQLIAGLLSGFSLLLDLNGVTASIQNVFEAGVNRYAGLLVKDNASSQKTGVAVDRFFATGSDGALRAYIGVDEYNGPSGLKSGGGIVLYHSDDPSNYRVGIACGAAPSSPNGVEVANGAAFIADGSPGVTGTYTFGTKTVTIKKGIITSVV